MTWHGTEEQRLRGEHMRYVNHIRVWAFDKAPLELQALSRNGGDEDWLALVPPEYDDRYVGWLESPAFGCCCVDEYEHPELPGYTVHIGSHA